MKRTITSFILILFMAFIFSEGVMRIRHGVTHDEPVPHWFKISYLNIYKPFFKKIHKKDKEVYILNPDQSDLDTFAREFPVIKTPHTVRIFIVGGSVAAYFHEFPLENILKDLIPGKDFEVINCGVGGYDSYRVSLIEKEILSYEPDLILVLSGNNENYDPVKVNVRSYYIDRFLKKSWTYRKLQSWLLQWFNTRRGRFARDKKKKLADYERNIRRIVRQTKAKNIPIILCSIPFVLKDYPPKGEVYPLDKQFLTLPFLLKNGDYLKVIERLKNSLKSNPDSSFGFYFLGYCYEQMKDYQNAKQNYSRAVELTGSHWPNANPSSNNIIRRICANEGIGFADLELAFMKIAPHGLPGREQFRDNCHWWSDYYSLVMEVILGVILDNDAIYSSIFNSNKYRSELASFSAIPYLLSWEQRVTKISCVERQMSTAIFEVAERNGELSEIGISYFETLYRMSPDSLWKVQFLQENFRELFLSPIWPIDYLSMFDKIWQRTFCFVGETYCRLGLYKEALEYFNEAIALDKNDYLPYIGRALVYYFLKDDQKAGEDINKAEELSGNLEVKYYKEILGF